MLLEIFPLVDKDVHSYDSI